jgi:hypothetical protein
MAGKGQGVRAQRPPRGKVGGAPRTLEIEGIDVGSWAPGPPGSGPPTEVHLSLRLAGRARPLVARFDKPEQVDLLVTALVNHRADCWGAPGYGAEPEPAEGQAKLPEVLPEVLPPPELPEADHGLPEGGGPVS